ncbi:MAG: helix-turn-helix domain-containing protein [Candidatus Pacebacteria bacterium]|nr:helix-turn-helix domain-containing protein [Candidatus Paceibacterota bacterium]
MNIKLIKTKKDYEEALKRVEELWNAKVGSSRADELEVLSVLIEKYEEENYRIDAPDPIEAIKFRMNQLGMQRKDLARIIGQNRVSEIFNKKRGLSLKMIKTLNRKLNIPADSLLGSI